MITPEEMELFLEYYSVQEVTKVEMYQHITDTSLINFVSSNSAPIEPSFQIDGNYEPSYETLSKTRYAIVSNTTLDFISEHNNTTDLKIKIQSLINELMSEITKSHLQNLK